MPPSLALGVPDIDLRVRVRRIGGTHECMTTHCPNPARLSVEVTDRGGRMLAFRACPECRSTALLAILEER